MTLHFFIHIQSVHTWGVALKPQWHSNDLDKGIIKVVMTSSSDDPELFQPIN
jgi:hypothetical protein